MKLNKFFILALAASTTLANASDKEAKQKADETMVKVVACRIATIAYGWDLSHIYHYIPVDVPRNGTIKELEIATKSKIAELAKKPSPNSKIFELLSKANIKIATYNGTPYNEKMPLDPEAEGGLPAEVTIYGWSDVK